jgi:molybdenum cofactor cytidylyltransferase
LERAQGEVLQFHKSSRFKDYMDKRPTAGIILAAGMSRRFGKLKQLLKIGDSTILSMVIDAALRSDLDRVVLVLGHEADQISSALGDMLFNPRLAVVVNPLFQEGMSTSLKRGIKEVRDRFPSIMILLGDQPLLSRDVINHMLERYRSSDKDICVPSFRGKRGLPVCIAERFYDDILKVTGDMGAREIIRNNPADVLEEELEDPACFMDIDEEADLERIKILLGITLVQN